ncbi:hypothetical protein [Nannocystis pusilla]|uniref:hypothetical protein n=1 Tax=Nannocystis pusilla TaxID=889268 RepID=UPI003B7D0185
MDPHRRARVTRSVAGDSRWEVATRELPAGLQAHVRGLLGYSEATALPCLRREFPLPQVVVIIEFGPPIRVHDGDGKPSRYAGGFVAGLNDCWTETGHDGAQAGIQLNLTPIGARLLFGVALSELAGRVVHLDDLLPRAHRAWPSASPRCPTGMTVSTWSKVSSPRGSPRPASRSARSPGPAARSRPAPARSTSAASPASSATAAST